MTTSLPPSTIARALRELASEIHRARRHPRDGARLRVLADRLTALRKQLPSASSTEVTRWLENAHRELRDG